MLQRNIEIHRDIVAATLVVAAACHSSSFVIARERRSAFVGAGRRSWALVGARWSSLSPVVASRYSSALVVACRDLPSSSFISKSILNTLQSAIGHTVIIPVLKCFHGKSRSLQNKDGVDKQTSNLDQTNENVNGSQRE